MAEQRRQKTGHDRAENTTMWLTNVVNGLVFKSSRVWKSHSPDAFDFIYARMLFHTGELLKRFSEDTVYDILADIEVSAAEGGGDIDRSVACEQHTVADLITANNQQSATDTFANDQASTSNEQERETVDCLSEIPDRSPTLDTRNTNNDSDHYATVVSDKDDSDTMNANSLQSQEWFSHLLVQQFVNKQLEVMDMYNDDFISFDEIIGPKDNYEDLYKVPPANWRCTGMSNNNAFRDLILSTSPATFYYSNPFDIKPMLHDLAFTRENCQTTNTCSWSHTLAGLLTPDEMASVYNFGMPTTYERHVHEYRRFLNDLSLDGVLKEPASMLQLSATPQYHRNSIHPLEVLRMDRVIPIDWHQLSVTELDYMKRITNDAIRQIWKDATAQSASVRHQAIFRRNPGPSRRPGGNGGETTRDIPTIGLDGASSDVHHHADGSVFVPTFRCTNPTNYLGAVVSPVKDEQLSSSLRNVEQKPAIATAGQRLATVANLLRQDKNAVITSSQPRVDNSTIQSTPDNQPTIPNRESSVGLGSCTTTSSSNSNNSSNGIGRHQPLFRQQQPPPSSSLTSSQRQAATRNADVTPPLRTDVRESASSPQHASQTPIAAAAAAASSTMARLVDYSSRQRSQPMPSMVTRQELLYQRGYGVLRYESPPRQPHFRPPVEYQFWALPTAATATHQRTADAYRPDLSVMCTPDVYRTDLAPIRAPEAYRCDLSALCTPEGYHAELSALRTPEAYRCELSAMCPPEMYRPDLSAMRTPEPYRCDLSTMCTPTLTTQTQPINTVCGKDDVIWDRIRSRSVLLNDDFVVLHAPNSAETHESWDPRRARCFVQPIRDLTVTNSIIRNQQLIREQQQQQQQQQQRLLHCIQQQQQQQHLQHFP